MTQRSREKQARRMAARLGLILRKSRVDGTWMIVPAQGAVVASGWTLKAVEKWLDTARKA